MNKTRREFLGLAGAVSVATAFHPANAGAEPAAHPFAGLTEIVKREGQITLGQPYAPSGKHSLVLFMTAQETEPSCGAGFIALDVVQSGLSQRVEPIMIMPRPVDQLYVDDLRNLNRALSGAYTVQVYSGDFATIQNAALASNAGFETNAAGKITGHGEEAILLDPAGQFIEKINVNQPLPFILKDVRDVTENTEPAMRRRSGLASEM